MSIEQLEHFYNRGMITEAQYRNDKAEILVQQMRQDTKVVKAYVCNLIELLTLAVGVLR